MNARPALLLSLLISTLPGTLPAQETKSLDARAFARAVQAVPGPVHPWRYAQDPEPGPQTKHLLVRRHAFYPGERVSVGFRLPPGTRLAAPLRVGVALSMQDLQGTKVETSSEGALSAAGDTVEGRLEWTVPPVAAGRVPAERALHLPGRPAPRDAAATSCSSPRSTPASWRRRRRRSPARGRRPRGSTPSCARSACPRPRCSSRTRRCAGPTARTSPRATGATSARTSRPPGSTPSGWRPARTPGRAAPAPSRRPTAPRSTARCSRTRSTSRPPTTRRRPGR